MISQTITLRRAIIWTVVLSLLIPAILISGLSKINRYENDIKNRTQELLELNAEILSKGMQEPLRNANKESVLALLQVMMHNEDIVGIEVKDNTLDVFASSIKPERRHGFTAATKKNVEYGGKTIGSIYIEVSSERLQRILLDDLMQSMIALTAQVALSIALVLILLEKRLIKPLQRLGRSAERLANRQWDTPFSWARLDEIGILSQRLETTRASLNHLFKELGEKNMALELDIDQRKRIEQELFEEEERYRVLVEYNPIAIIEWDKNYCVIEWNTAAENIFGYSRKAAMGKHASFIIPNLSKEAVDALFVKLIAGKGATKSISKNVRADGAIITCQWRNAHIIDKSGHAGRLVSMGEDISEKQNAEEAYRLSQAKFASAFHGSPDYMTISRMSDGVLVDVNAAYERFTGLDRQYAIGKSTLALNLWFNQSERAALVEKLDAQGVARDFPVSLRTRNDEIRACLVDANTFNVGNETHMLAVVRDVTDQRRMEQQKAEVDRVLLRLAQGIQGMASESFFELLVTDLATALGTDRAFIGLCKTDAPNRIHTIAAFTRNRLTNNFEYSISGSPCEHILSGEISVFPKDIQTLFPQDAALAEQGWESYAGAPIRDNAGNSIGVLAVMDAHPLSNPDLVKSLLQVFSERASSELERKRNEEALRNSQQQFSAMFHASPVPMLLLRFGSDQHILDVNRAFEMQFHRKQSETIGRNTLQISFYCDPNDRQLILDTLKQKKHIDRYETWVNLGDGSKALIQMSGNIFDIAGEEFTILTAIDITEKHFIENEILEVNANLEHHVAERTEELQKANKELAATLNTLNLAQEELVRSEKLAALGSLVAGIAHELNTPIGNSLMVASTLADRTRSFSESYANGLKRSALESYIEDSAKASDILVRNLYRAADLVTSFKQVAVDQTSSQRRVFSLSEVTSEIIMTLSPTLKKTSVNVMQSIPTAIRMDSYPGPLGQVVNNLVNNALLHGFEGRNSGTISIVAQSTAEDWIELIVKDNGVGIPAANLSRIFDPFFTTKLGAGGSGLGLNITHTLVTSLLGGRIQVQSEVGIGTSFIISLPTTAPLRDHNEAVNN
ncbi:MAG TPA: PAS domain S-box protein [Burkholderiaceae bacterium]|jgi:PAS domain S-box-containing protein